MIRAALRDLQFRRRRFAIATLGAALVFGLSVTMSGLSASFDNEVERTVAVADADAWVVDESASRPFAGNSGMPQQAVEEVAAAPGVVDAAGLVFNVLNVGNAENPQLVNVFGVEPGHVGAPAALSSTEDAVVDENLGVGVGETLEVSGREFEVVDVIRASLFAGSPNVYIELGAAQQIGFAGQPIITSVLASGELEALDGFRVLDNRGAEENALLSLGDAGSTISMVRTILWFVAALVIGSVLYLNAQERTRDFAVFKATGTTSAAIVIGLAVQAAAIAAVASILAVIVGLFLAPVMPMAVETPLSAYLLMPVVVLIVSIIGSLAGARRAATVPPAVAFAG